MEEGKSRRIRKLITPDEKYRSRKLYREVFSEDSETFLNFYYSERCKDNLILSVEENEEIIGMLHMNPYNLKIRGEDERIRETECVYIYGVATKAEYRHQGIMRDLLSECFSILKKREIPLSFLIPVDEEIYLPFGFETICDFQNPMEIEFSENDEDLERNFDVFCARDKRYWEIVSGERKIASIEGSEGLPQSPVVMMKVTDSERLQKLINGTRIMTDSEFLSYIRRQRVLISEDI